MATNSEIKAFIDKFSKLALEECNRRIAEGLPFVLPSVCLAQSALECDWGVAGLMKKANAFFGIKAGGNWKGKIYVADTWEVAANGTRYNTVANFRAYDSPEESMRDYYSIICGLSRYEKSWSYGNDPSKWLSALETIKAIHAGGYATDNLYVTKIMNTINGRDLTKIDGLITGVSTGGSGYVSGFTLNKSDFIQGALVLADSGRSITNDRSITSAISTNWEKAVEINSGGQFQIPTVLTDLPVLVTLAVQYLSTSKLINISAGTPVTIEGAAKIGLMIRSLDGSNIDVDDVLSDDVVIPNANTPSGEEIIKTALAFFVKIE